MRTTRRFGGAGINPWPGAVFALLGLNVAIVGVTVYASRQRGMEVEPRYYERALAQDEIAELRARSDALGWRVSASISLGARPELRLTIRDHLGQPVTGAIVQFEAIPNTASTRREVISAQEHGEGVYTAALASRIEGLWTVRVQAVRGVEAFSSELTAWARAGQEPE